jgi:hypothetical protein
MSRAGLFLLMALVAAPVAALANEGRGQGDDQGNAYAYGQDRDRGRDRPVVTRVPEIDAGKGLAALAVTACGVLLVWERRRRSA